MHLLRINWKKFITDAMHCFELHTSTISYFVGEDTVYTQSSRDLPGAESGLGAHVAKSWETSIRQALMPVLSNTSKSYTYFS